MNTIKIDEHIFNFKSLERYRNHAEALELLKKLASHVKPIMQKHNWKVGVLEEFFPQDQRLLGININRGEKICIRLRPHYDESRFIDFNDLIGTLLHELTHNKYGPHDAAFYKQLDELHDEYDELLINGKAGEGFYGSSYKVGQGVSHNDTPAMARQKALKAAELRKIMTHGGIKLGGVGWEHHGVPMRELTAVAAERRQNDMVWCGSERIGDSNGKSNSENDVAKTQYRGSSSAVRIPADKIPGINNTPWSCPKCTFENKPLALQCEICLNIKPDTKQQSQDFLPIEFLSPQWDCPRCTYRNEGDMIMCTACDYLKN
ncbi:8615_t:CDS:2 [Cetraspora pellucida]|uniref:8615_t:CDS:1 n=1 Tax=Cetraspora pellucida TaxID=1433469 RepID=A0A9N9NWX2_9GLOM|nr:8615_t:CDS:2 [Cetraspora pellucida]